MTEQSPQGQFAQTLDDVLSGREPVAVVNSVGAMLTAGLALASYYGYVLADSAADLWFAFATIVLVAVIKPLRNRVTPVAKTQSVIDRP